MRKYLKLLFLGIFLLLVICDARSVCFADHKDDALDLRNKGLLAQRLGNIDKALNFYLQARKKWSSWPVIYNDIGVIYEFQLRINEAEAVYLKAIQFDPYYASSYTNLAFLYEKKQDFKNAIFYWKKRIQLGDVDDPWAKTARERIAILRNKIGLQEGDSTDELIKQVNKDISRYDNHIFPFSEIIDLESIDDLSMEEKITKIRNAKARAKWLRDNDYSVMEKDQLEMIDELEYSVELERVEQEKDQLLDLDSEGSLELLRELSKDDDPEVRKSADDALWYNSQGFGMLAKEEAERINQMRSLPSSKSQIDY
ncbi:MAG: tetratricopeptide repeat protein [Candidatus Gygaella obscura]|nr:tetratricopeptide repeat protein [Candidatus Gygaella obscura]